VGGVLIGAALIGTGGTLATFSDSVALPASAGADELALTLDYGTSPLKLMQPNNAPASVHVTRAGSGAVALWLSVRDGEGANACDAPANPQVIIGRTDDHPGNSGKVASVGLCDLVQSPEQVLGLAAAETSATLTLRVTAGDAGGGQTPKGWNGTLRFVLVPQGSSVVERDGALVAQGGGFSDQQDVPAVVSKPGNATPGGPDPKGNSGSQLSAAE
jgi:hypothetical protein